MQSVTRVGRSRLPTHIFAAPVGPWRSDERSGTRHAGRIRAIVRLAASVVVLGGLVVAYFLQPGIGSGTPGDTVPAVSVRGPSWGAVVEEARMLQAVIPDDAPESARLAAVDRWSPQIADLADDMAVLVAAQQPVSIEVADAIPELRSNQQALGAFGDRTPDQLDVVLSDIVDDAAVLASAERSVRMMQLESASRSAVHVLGLRMLVVAMTAVAATVGVIGLTISVSELGAVSTPR